MSKKSFSADAAEESERVYFLIKGGKNSNFIAFSLSIPPKRRQIRFRCFTGKTIFPIYHLYAEKRQIDFLFFLRALFPRNAPEKKTSERPKGNGERSEAVNLLRRECLFYAADEGKLTAFHKFFEEFGYFSPLC